MLMLRNQAIKQVKVQWNHFGPDEATWEIVDWIRAMYPSLFAIEAKQFWHGVLIYVLVYVLVMLVYVHMYMDVNTTMSYVIKIQ